MDLDQHKIRSLRSPRKFFGVELIHLELSYHEAQPFDSDGFAFFFSSFCA